MHPERISSNVNEAENFLIGITVSHETALTHSPKAFWLGPRVLLRAMTSVKIQDLATDELAKM
jgi:hypothetical protein